MLDPCDFAADPALARDADNVEAHAFTPKACLAKIALGKLDEFPSFLGADRMDPSTGKSRATGPDFDKDEHPTVQSHHIEFTESTTPIAGDNPQSLASQVPRGNPLAPPA